MVLGWMQGSSGKVENNYEDPGRGNWVESGDTDAEGRYRGCT